METFIWNLNLVCSWTSKIMKGRNFRFHLEYIFQFWHFDSIVSLGIWNLYYKIHTKNSNNISWSCMIQDLTIYPRSKFNSESKSMRIIIKGFRMDLAKNWSELFLTQILYNYTNVMHFTFINSMTKIKISVHIGMVSWDGDCSLGWKHCLPS